MRIGMIARAAGGARELSRRLHLAQALARTGAQVHVLGWLGGRADAVAAGEGVALEMLDPADPSSTACLPAALRAAEVDLIMASPGAWELDVASRAGLEVFPTSELDLGTDAVARHRAPRCGRRADLLRWAESACGGEAPLAEALAALDVEHTPVVIGWSAGGGDGAKALLDRLRAPALLATSRCIVWNDATSTTATFGSERGIEGPRISPVGERHLLACADLAVIDAEDPAAHAGLWLDAMAHGAVPLVLGASAAAELREELAPFVGDALIERLELDAHGDCARVAAWLVEGAAACGAMLRDVARSHFDWNVRARRLVRLCEPQLR